MTNNNNIKQYRITENVLNSEPHMVAWNWKSADIEQFAFQLLQDRFAFCTGCVIQRQENTPDGVPYAELIAVFDAAKDTENLLRIDHHSNTRENPILAAHTRYEDVEPDPEFAEAIRVFSLDRGTSINIVSDPSIMSSDQLQVTVNLDIAKIIRAMMKADENRYEVNIAKISSDAENKNNHIFTVMKKLKVSNRNTNNNTMDLHQVTRLAPSFANRRPLRRN